MKKTLLSLIAVATMGVINAQVVINEIDPATKSVELKNIGSSPVDVSNYVLCDFPTYTDISNSSLTKEGSTTIAPGGFLVIKGWNLKADAELGLYFNRASGFGNASNIADYIEWGSTGHTRSAKAVEAGVWTAGSFLPELKTGESVEYDGSGDRGKDYRIQTSTTLGQENSVVLNLFDFNETASIVVFPNPTVNVVRVDSEDVVSLKILSLEGVELASSVSNEVNVASLVKGTYIVEVITTSNKVLTSKVVKD